VSVRNSSRPEQTCGAAGEPETLDSTRNALKISKNGQSIESVASWFEFAPPKEGERQWVDLRSAKELARAFCGPAGLCVPAELQNLLDSNSSLGHIEITEAWPEHKIALDSFRGETRNADLAALATSRAGTVALTVEAKADESFGELVGTVLANAPERSKVPKRLETLASGLFGGSIDVSNVRYQLLHGVAASLIFAAEQETAVAVFTVLEFHSPSCSEENLRRNASDLQAFMGLFGGASAPLLPGQLSGPYSVPGRDKIPSGIPLFVGKAIREIGRRAV
jgi:hypothetical protein